MLKEMSVEIIRKCPNMCLHCSSLSSLKCTEYMPYEKFAQITEDASKLGADLICLSGGEPFLHSDLVHFVEAIADAGMSCAIYTSGIALDGKMEAGALPVSVLEKLSALPVKLIFNVEAGTEETYDKMMGTKHCFPLLKESIGRTIHAGIPAEANFVPTAVNYREIYQTVALCEQLGISKVNFLKLVVHGRAEQNRTRLEMTAEDYEELQGIFKELRENAGIAVRIGVPLSEGMGCAKCEAASGKLNIKYNGDVYPCEVFKNGNAGKTLCGFQPENIYEKRLAEIYHESPYLRCVREESRRFSLPQTGEPCIGQRMIALKEQKGGRST